MDGRHYLMIALLVAVAYLAGVKYPALGQRFVGG